MMGGQNYWQAE